MYDLVQLYIEFLDTLPKGPWWQRFRDPKLDALMEKALADSPTLVAANARLAQSRASLRAPSRSGTRWTAARGGMV